MKSSKHILTFSRKILLLLVASIAITILFSFFFIHFLYSNLYLKSIEESILYQGQRTASHYHYGELSEEIIEKIEWYNIISEYEIIVVDDLEQLTTQFPYEVDYNSLVTESDRTTLTSGQHIMKEGYVEQFDREILGAIFPIQGNEQLLGFIYIYVPLAAIQDVFRESLPLLLIFGLLFFFILFIIVNRFWSSLFGPLKQMQKQSIEVAKGNYTTRVLYNHPDEIGQLATAFNSMSESLEQQEKRKKEFTTNLVHELRTPLTYISGYTQALQQQMFTSPEEAAHYLTTIEKEAERLNKLLNDLIDLNHLQEDLYTVDKEPIAIGQLLQDTIDLFAIHIAQKSVTISSSISEEAIVFGDPKRIEQVFYNLIDNAIKYATTNTTLVIQLVEQEEGVLFSVTNQGTTISLEDQKRIGERFFRTDKARTRTAGGTGLGLSIVKEIIRLHEGNFSLTSDELNGTTIEVCFPTKQSE